MQKLFTTLLTFGLGLTLVSSSFAQKMYWVDLLQSKVQRSDLDGSNIEDLVTGVNTPSGISLDLTNSKMYFTAYLGNKIQRANLDGSNVEDLVTGLNGPLGITLDLTNSKIYWVSTNDGKIQRSDLDGTNVEDSHTMLGFPTSIKLDVPNSKMYWVDQGVSKIQRSNLDGSNVEDLVTNSDDGLVNPFAVTLDLTNSKMYWVDQALKKIQRSDLDGSNVEDIVTGLLQTTGLVFDISDSPLSVELNSFSVHQIGKTIGLNWSTASETENAGFNVYRKIGNSEFVQISSYENNSELVGSLNTSSNSFYTFVDNSNFKDNELYTYYISDIETNGKETKHTELAQSVVYEIKSQVVDRFQLKQNFPNPFNPSTTISYNLGESVDVSLTIYNEKGEFVKELVNENQSQGSHEVVWNGTDSFGKEVSSGTYFYKIETESFTRSHKMILLK